MYAACPGTQSTTAGKTSACQGCPNQKICASGKPSEPDPGNVVSCTAICEVSEIVLEFHFLRLGLETCGLGLAIYGLGLGLGPSGLETWT